jgi:hypothetical protein
MGGEGRGEEGREGKGREGKGGEEGEREGRKAGELAPPNTKTKLRLWRTSKFGAKSSSSDKGCLN